MNYLTEITQGVYIRTDKIKFIVDMKRKSATVNKIKKSAAENNKIYYNGSNKATKSFVVLDDDSIYYSIYLPDTIARNILASGKKMILVDSDTYVSVQHILAVFDSEESRLVNSDGKKMASNDLQFLRKFETKKTFLLMTTGETVGLSNTPSYYLNLINSND